MKTRNIIIAFVFMLMPVLSEAQVLKGSYFLENSIDRNKMNPAFAPRANYLQLPLVGNTVAGLYTNWFGMETLFPELGNGKFGTFLHPDISVEEFAKNLADYPHVDANFDLNVFSLGFYTKRKSFWTFDVGMRAYLDTDWPRDLFTFLKAGTGLGTQSHNIANFNAYLGTAATMSLGYSRDLSSLLKGLRVGVRARVIAPLLYAGINLENVRLTTSDEAWKINTEGYINLAIQGLNMGDVSVTPDEESTQMPSVGFNLQQMINNKVIAGLGYSFDIGFEYKLSTGCFLDGLSVSAALTDLGRITYSSSAVRSFSTNGEFVWEGLKDASLDTDFESFFTSVTDDAMSSLVNIKDNGSAPLVTSARPSFYAGVEVPFLWRRASVGLLYSARKSHSYLREELTASLNLKPGKWLALGVNYSFLNSSKLAGWILEFTPKVGPAFRVGMDYIFYDFYKAPILANLGVPEMISYLPSGNVRLNFSFGCALNLGSRYGR